MNKLATLCIIAMLFVSVISSPNCFLTPMRPQSGIHNTNWSQTYTLSGTPTSSNVTFVNLPSWCSVQSSNVAPGQPITYTIGGVCQQGSYPIQIRYFDDQGTARTRLHTIVIYPTWSGDDSQLWSLNRSHYYLGTTPSPISVSCSTNPRTSYPVNTPIPPFWFTPSGGSGNSYIWEVNNIPTGLVFNGGNCSGTPTAVGVYTIGIRVRDNYGNCGEYYHVINIQPVTPNLTPTYPIVCDDDADYNEAAEDAAIASQLALANANLVAAQAAVTAAQSAFNVIAASYQNYYNQFIAAQTASNNSYQAYVNANASYYASWAAYNSSQATYRASQSALATALANENTAVSTLTAAQNAFNSAQSAYNNSVSNLNQANATLNTAQSNYNAALSALNTANSSYVSAYNQFIAANSTLTTAYANLQTATTQQNNAYAAYVSANSTYTAAFNAFNQATTYLNSNSSALNNSYSQYQTALNTTNSLYASYGSQITAYNNALNTLNAAKAALYAAQCETAEAERQSAWELAQHSTSLSQTLQSWPIPCIPNVFSTVASTVASAISNAISSINQVIGASSATVTFTCGATVAPTCGGSERIQSVSGNCITTASGRNIYYSPSCTNVTGTPQAGGYVTYNGNFRGPHVWATQVTCH